MPIFEFQCTECDAISEEIVSFKIADKLLTIICPFCNGISNRMISLSSFHLKGGGWFKDGYGIKEPETKEKPVEITDKKPVEARALVDWG